MRAEKQPRLQSARWPGLGASSSGSLCKSANPREEKRGLGLGQPVKRHRPGEPKLPRRFPLTVAWPASAPQTESLGEEEARREMGKRHVFLSFSFSRSCGWQEKKEQSDNAALSQVRRCGSTVLCMRGAGAESGLRPGSGAAPPGGQISPPQGLVNSQLSNSQQEETGVTGERERAHCRRWPARLGPVQSVRAGGQAGVVERGDQGQVRLWFVVVEFAGFLSRGRCAKHQVPMGGSRPLIEEGRPMWCEGNCDAV